MKRPRPPKGQKMTTGLGDADGSFPERNARNAVIPILTHELQSIRRIRHDGIDGIRLHPAHYFQTIAIVYHVDINSCLTLARSAFVK
jgi:hypothetical protein